MLTNTAITVYNKRRDPQTRAITYLATVLEAVHWEPTKGVTISTNGIVLDIDTSSDKVSVHIPFTVKAGGRTYADPKAFAAMDSEAQAGRWTLTPGQDYIRKGADENAPQMRTEAQVNDVINSTSEMYVISTVKTFDMGSEHMRHWEVGGK